MEIIKLYKLSYSDLNENIKADIHKNI